MGLDQYTSSIHALLNKLGIEFVNLKEFNCCGYPLRNFNFRAFLLASARDLALAEKRALDVLTLCNCCYGNLKHAEHLMKEEPALRDEINATLAKEGLHYERGITTKHILQVLHDDLGIEHLRANLKTRFRGLKIATHYGCHILRPSKITQFDHPFMPTKLDQLVAVTGAESIPWLTKLECCGSPLTGVNDDLSVDLAEKKLVNAKEAGADYLCVSCPFCQMQFDRVQKMVVSHRGSTVFLPSILYIQLLGLCLGIDPQELGMKMNKSLFTGIQRFLSEN
jgi:heterodisulfide reductase subunit B